MHFRRSLLPIVSLAVACALVAGQKPFPRVSRHRVLRGTLPPDYQENAEWAFARIDVSTRR